MDGLGFDVQRVAGSRGPWPAELVEAGTHDAAGECEVALDHRRIVTASVWHPLAARPPKIVRRVASSSRWNGCGSNSTAKGLPGVEAFGFTFG